jgi:hypothetical protein
MSNDTSVIGVLEAVHDEYFILKSSREAKVREIVYYDGVKSAKEVCVINWKNFLNQKVGFETNDGTYHTGFFVSLVGISVEMIEKGGHKFYTTGDIKSINTVSFIEGDKLTLQNNVPATVEKVEKGKVCVSLAPSDLFVLTVNKEEVKTQNLNETNKTPLEKEEKEKLFFSSICKDIQTKLQNLKETNKTPLEKEKLFFSSIGKDIQTKLQNIKETNKTPLEQGKEMKILYRGKPKIITIINKYTKNDKEYAVITDHTDNDKTKTLFTSYIEIVN